MLDAGDLGDEVKHAPLSIADKHYSPPPQKIGGRFPMSASSHQANSPPQNSG